MKFSTRRKLKKACSLLLVLTMVMSMFTALPAGIFAVVASAESMIALDAEATTIDFVSNDNGANAAAALTSDTSTYTMADGAVTFTGRYQNNGSHGLQTSTQNYGNTIAVNVPAGRITMTLGICQYSVQGGVAKLYDSTSATPDVAVKEDVKFSTKGDDGAACTTTTVVYTMESAGVLTLALPYNCYLHNFSVRAETVVNVELDGEAINIDFKNTEDGTNAGAALTTDSSIYKMANGAVTFTGRYQNNGSHGLQTSTQNYGNTIAVNVPAGRITMTLGICQYSTQG
ncbi:MAG: hypothetical protein IJB96_04205, partial [Lachnospira sp.]|nr:hypothetical protein [Lachnospira sp.]